jgi:hypothetical protein
VFLNTIAPLVTVKRWVEAGQQRPGRKQVTMQELVELLAKALVDNPEAVQVKVDESDDTVLVELSVASEDMGKIIGKQGKIARAIRTLVKAQAAKTGKKVSVEIVS